MGKAYLKGVGMLVGMIFGAGVFALPFVFAKAGIFWGIFYFLIATTLIIFLHFLYGEISYYTSGRHRFVGYVEILLGEKAKWISFLVTVITAYGALLAYGLLGGIFLSNFFPLPADIFTVLVFILGSFFIFFNFEKIAAINFYLSIGLLGLVIYLLIVSLPSVNMANFKSIFNSNWFLPYGIWLFSLAGFAVVPEVRDMVGNFPIKFFKKIILVSVLICAISYLIFIFSVVGVSGVNTTEDALSGISGSLGSFSFLLGSALGFLAIFTSFIALAVDLKYIFRYDLHFPFALSWLATSAPPIILFMFGAKNLVYILGITGSIGVGAIGIFIILMSGKLREKMGKVRKFSTAGWVAGALLVLGTIAAVLFELI